MVVERERIVIADDHPVFREGLRRVVQRIAPTAEITETGSLDELVEVARRGDPPSTLIVDLLFSGGTIEPHLPSLRDEFQRTSLIVVSMVEDPSIAHRLMSHGIDGFVSKSVSPGELRSAIESIREGETILKLSTEGPPADVAPATVGLTPRQRDVLLLLTEGKSNKEIAAGLAISPFTVRVHVSALLKLLGTKSRTAAAIKAVEDGWLS